MKNIYIINQNNRSISYGIGTYSHLLSECLKRSGKLHVITLNVGNINELVRYEKDEIIYINIPSPRQISNSHRQKENRYQRNAFYTILPHLNLNEKTIFFFNFSSMNKLGELLKEKLKCQIILIVHFTYWGIKLSGDIEPIKKILKHQSNNTEIEIKKCFDEEQYCMQKIADYVIAISQHSYNTMHNLYKIPKRKLTLIPHGIKDTYIPRTAREKYILRKKYYLNKNDKILIYVGRLDYEKGVELLVESFSRVLCKEPNAKLLIIGDGNFSSIMKRAFPYWSRIIFTGYLEQEQLSELYAIADVGIVPSLYEEFGYVALEMMMYKIPIIANSTTGLKELIEKDINGEIVDLREHTDGSNTDKLSESILTIIENKWKRNIYIKNSRDIFLSKYSFEKYEQKIKKMILNWQ